MRTEFLVEMMPAMDPERIRVVLDICRDVEPIEGELIEPRSTATRFCGWLSFTSLIEAIRQPNENQIVDADAD